MLQPHFFHSFIVALLGLFLGAVPVLLYTPIRTSLLLKIYAVCDAFTLPNKPTYHIAQFSSHHFFIFLCVCSAFFSFHLYLIQQGKTTNETFKWAALLSSGRKVWTGHQQYPSLEQPDSLQKVESASLVDDICNYCDSINACEEDCERHRNDNNADRSDTVANATRRKDNISEKVSESPESCLGPSSSQLANNIQALRADVAIIGSNGGSSLEEAEQMRDLGTDCRQRSDSTSDGAVSAVIELCGSNEKRKIGSSSSGSTSSSKRYCYCDVSDDDEDYKLAEDTDDDRDIVYLESNCRSKGKCAVSGIEEKGTEGQAWAKAATVAIIEAEAALEAEDLAASCITASNATLEPLVEKSLFTMASKSTGLIPDNLYKKDLFSAIRNVLVPPSTDMLRALYDRRGAVAALSSDTGGMHTD